IATGFVRKLYRILDQESGAVISWTRGGTAFIIFDAERLNELILPRYFRGRLCAFRQQLREHGFRELLASGGAVPIAPVPPPPTLPPQAHTYFHEHFVRGAPGRLSQIPRTPLPRRRVSNRKNKAAGGAPLSAAKRVAAAAVAKVAAATTAAAAKETAGGSSHKRARVASAVVAATATGAVIPAASSSTASTSTLSSNSCTSSSSSSSLSSSSLSSTASAPAAASDPPRRASSSLALVPAVYEPEPPPPTKRKQNPLFSNESDAVWGGDWLSLDDVAPAGASLSTVGISTDFAFSEDMLGALMTLVSSSMSTTANPPSTCFSSATASCGAKLTAAPALPPLGGGMAAGIATGFVRKLYRILDLESDAVISWDASGASFSIHDAAALNERVLPRYFRGRLCAFRQQLTDHGFEPLECEDNDPRESYRHPHFARGRPAQLSLIERVPKPKRKAGSSTPAATAHAAPKKAPAATQTAPPRLLTVTLSGVKRPSTAPAAPPKRARTPTDQQQQPSPSLQVRPGNAYVIGRAAPASTTPPASGNPLFSNEPDAAALAFARLAESGLLPHSSELPEPISYLVRQPLAAGNGNAAPASVVVAPPQTRVPEPPVFSDDLFRSALLFLASTSTTGADLASNNGGGAGVRVGVTAKGDVTVPSNLLSMLLASSTSGMPAASTASSGGSWGGGAANPLFSDQSTAEDEDDQDSIWNLLVASSVDRTRSAISAIESPHERLRVILAERELLEEQRKRFGRGSASGSDAVGGSATSAATTTTPSSTVTTTATTTTTPATSASVSKAAVAAAAALNPLFAKPRATTNPLFAKPPAPTPATTTTTATAVESRSSNPLFAKSSASQNPLFAKSASALVAIDEVRPSPASLNVRSATSSSRSGAASAPNEDDLWRLLMSSSIDSFRRFTEFEV
ncbi:hypothetical protein PybrP1_006684, partial [[Pythium] brassicae (nom. inval.)]